MRAGPALDQLAKEYPNDVRIVFKQHPLPMHQHAAIAAEAAMAASAQGKFPEMHKKLLENSSTLSRDKILEIAKGIGLDVDRFTKDLDSHTYKASIDKQTAEAEAIGASGTPASFVNGRYLSGAKPYNMFKDLVDEELKWAREKNRPAFVTGKHVRETQPPSQQAQRGPDPLKAYDIPVGNSPIVGSAKAKVTILHYLDYQ